MVIRVSFLAIFYLGTSLKCQDYFKIIPDLFSIMMIFQYVSRLNISQHVARLILFSTYIESRETSPLNHSKCIRNSNYNNCIRNSTILIVNMYSLCYTLYGN